MEKPAPEARRLREDAFKLLPLLILYLAFAAWKAKPTLQWDEGRYFLNAQNLLKGYFASIESLMFWNGPGYPLYLVPIVGLKLPLLVAKLGNACFLYLGVVYFAGALRLCGISARRLLYAYALGIFLLLHGSLIEYLMTEALSAFLVSGAVYHFLHATLRANSPRLHLGATALHLGYLALTKVFFGYVLTAGLVIAFGWWAIKRWAPRHPGGASAGASPASPSGLAAWACGLGLVVCLPYLSYTYAKTGKLFFWSNSGGSQLFCMTLPQKELLGDWLNFEEVLFFPDFFKDLSVFYRKLDQMDYLSRDQAFKRAALENIRAHPAKVFQNWRANLNRMVFGFPVSRYPGSDPELSTGNRSFVYALPFFLCAFAAWPAWKRRRAIPAGVWVALAFAGIALGGLSLLSTFPRMVFPLLPVLGLWLAVVLESLSGDVDAAAHARRAG